MSDNVYVNAGRSAVVEETAPGKKWQMPRKEAVRLGLLADGEAKPQARRNAVVEDTSRPVTTESVPQDSERVLATPVASTRRAARKK